MNEVMVSVVMPCLNSKEFIRETIESILNQTLKEIELIAVDAGSTDGTIEIIEEYRNKDDRVVLLHSEKKSLGCQDNMGIKYAKGKYIGIVESDDYIDLEMYENLVKIAEANNLDFIKSDFDMFIGDKSEKLFLNYSILSTANSNLYNTVLAPSKYPEIIYRDVNMWNGIYKREFIEINNALLNETNGAAFQDTGFVLKTFMQAKRIMYVHIPSYFYRKDNMNASVYNKAKHIKFVMDEMKFITEFMNDKKIESPFRAIVFKRLFGMFCAFYDEYQNLGCKIDDIEIQLEGFFDFIKENYDKINYYEKNEETLDKILSLVALTKSKKDFKLVRENISYLNHNYRKDFFNFIKDKSIVIFGAGEIGTALYACLYRNKIKNVLCFADNNVEKQGTNIMGLECMSLEQIIENYLKNNYDVCFVIANIRYDKEIRNQLLNNGISKKKIIKSLDIIPHVAFELNLEEV